jgi:hypothetical protein
MNTNQNNTQNTYPQPGQPEKKISLSLRQKVGLVLGGLAVASTGYGILSAVEHGNEASSLQSLAGSLEESAADAGQPAPSLPVEFADTPDPHQAVLEAAEQANDAANADINMAIGGAVAGAVAAGVAIGNAGPRHPMGY